MNRRKAGELLLLDAEELLERYEESERLSARVEAGFRALREKRLREAGPPRVRVGIGASVVGFLTRIDRLRRRLGEIEGAGRTLPRNRPLLCRLGLHRWSAWDVTAGNFRTLSSKCRRCGAGRLLVFKGRSVGRSEDRGVEIAALLRRIGCRTKEERRPRPSASSSRRVRRAR